MGVAGVPSYFWLGDQSSKKFGLIELVDESRDITINGVKAIV